MQKKGQSSTSIYNVYFHNGWLNAAFHQKYAPAGEETAGNPISGGTRESENDDRPGNFATRLVSKNELVFTDGKACPVMDTQSRKKRGHLSLFGFFRKLTFQQSCPPMKTKCPHPDTPVSAFVGS